MNRRDILKIVEDDPWMMDVLRTARTLDLLDWWIGGGFVRNKVWDVLHNYKTRTPFNDVDLIFLIVQTSLRNQKNNMRCVWKRC